MSVTVEQARRLSEAAGVDVIAALSALERHNGDALEAMLELERMGLTPVPPGAAFTPPAPPPAALPRHPALYRRRMRMVLSGAGYGFSPGPT